MRSAREARAARQSLPRKKLFAVVPAYNESDGIAGVVAELRELRLPGYELELVVVDDGSSDDTRARAAEAGAAVVALPFNLGIGATVQTGFQYALDHGADFVVQVDGDGQHIPVEIEKLLPASAHADVVVGSRFARGGKEGLAATTVPRWLAGRVLSWTIHVLTGRRLTDTTSGFRLFNRRAAEFVAARYPDDYPEVQVLVKLASHGFRVAEAPVRMRHRQHGRSSINGWRALYYVLKVTFASFMDKVRR